MTLTRFVKTYLLEITLVLLIIGCTIVPHPLTDKYPSWDGTNLTSGVITLTNNNTAAVITEKARLRYNSLILTYGNTFVPPLAEDFGVTPLTTNTYLITAEGLSYFIQMNKTWKSRQ